MSAPFSTIRPPAVAGTFYPADPGALRRVVEGMLAEAAATEHGQPDETHTPPKALIAPHAGYIYSGPIAAHAYRLLARVRGQITRVVLLGPAHRVPFGGLAVPSAAAFRTPLGDVPLDRAALDRALAFPQVREFDRAFDGEHCLEVHLPFLQVALGEFRLVPFVVGTAGEDEVDQVLEALWGGPETLIVISSDLSHYHDYATARALDLGAARAIEALRGDALGDEQACGRYPIKGLLRRARALGLHATRLDLRNSGDTAGDKAHVVGYGAWAFGADGNGAKLSPGERAALGEIARGAIGDTAAHRRAQPVDLAGLPPALRDPRASFVTVKLAGELRGCIGTVEAARPLAEDVAFNAGRAVSADPRFPPVTVDEAGRLGVGISVLSPLEAIAFRTERELLARLIPGVDGLVIASGPHRALFLPQVWEMAPDPAEFLQHLKHKAGIRRGLAPAPRLEAWRFTAESFAV